MGYDFQRGGRQESRNCRGKRLEFQEFPLACASQTAQQCALRWLRRGRGGKGGVGEVARLRREFEFEFEFELKLKFELKFELKFLPQRG